MPTLGEYRRRLAQTAGFLIVTQASAGSAQPQQLVCSEFQSTSLEPTFLGNTWVYQPTGPNAGQARRVVYQGLDTPTGIVTVDRPFGAATPQGTPLEFYGRLPPINTEGRTGLNELVNRTLAECWTIKKISITATSDSQRFWTINPPYTWLSSEDQIVDVYSFPANPTTGTQDELQATWQWRPDADNPTIECGRALNMGDLCRILAITPMSWWINPAGTGWLMPASPGLSGETDQGLLPILGMEQVGKAYVYDELAKWGLPDDQQVYRQLAARARAAANEYKRLTLQRPKRRTLHWPASMVVPGRWSYAYGAGQATVARG